MPIKIDGSGGIAGATTYSSITSSMFRNRLMNGTFNVNQRIKSGTVTLTAGQYGHDRWKAGAAGCTYTFAVWNNVTAITITAGSLLQIIGDGSIEGGDYVLSWQGTTQGRINSGTYSGTPIIINGITAGDNVTVEFNVGTLSYPQLEPGITTSTFEFRPYSMEENMCSRYYVGNVSVVQMKMTTNMSLLGIALTTTNFGGTPPIGINFPVTMRAVPTPVFYTTAAKTATGVLLNGSSTPTAVAGKITVNCTTKTALLYNNTMLPDSSQPGTYYTTVIDFDAEI